MANLRNEFEFRSALLTALGQEHTEAEAKNEEMWRRKMLDGLGVEYDQNDVNQFGLFREKLIEGVTKKSEGGGGETWNTVFEGNVTTENVGGIVQGNFMTKLNSTDTIKVIFNGTEYICELKDDGYDIYYGGDIDDFSVYPFRLKIMPDRTLLYTESAGTYSLKIEEPQSGGGESDFSTAEVTIINNSSTTYNPNLAIIEDDTLKTTGNITKQNSATFNEVLLYKGSRSFVVALLTPTVEGNASVSGNTVTITGDCTITVSGGL